MNKIFVTISIIVIVIVILLSCFVLSSSHSNIRYYKSGEYYEHFDESDEQKQIYALKKENPVINSFIAFISFDHRFISGYECLGEYVIGLKDNSGHPELSTKAVWGTSPRGSNPYLSAWAYKYGYEYNRNLAGLLGYNNDLFQLDEKYQLLFDMYLK